MCTTLGTTSTFGCANLRVLDFANFHQPGGNHELALLSNNEGEIDSFPHFMETSWHFIILRSTERVIIISFGGPKFHESDIFNGFLWEERH